MRIAFMGTPAFAVPSLDALIAAGHDIAAVYTQPPRPAGRGKTLRPSPVQLRAQQAGLETRTPASLRGLDEQAAFAALDLDLAVVAAYGLILPEAILTAPRGGCINVHASILPRWRGAAPIQRAILAGDEETGITLMQMDKGLDTGEMIAIRRTPINGKTAGELTEELARMGGDLLAEMLAAWPDVRRTPQDDSLATYAAKIGKSETRLDFNLGAAEVERQVRAYNPFPGAWFEHLGERIKVLEARAIDHEEEAGTVIDHPLVIACASGALVPVKVQRAGRAAMTPDALLRGFEIAIGTRLG